jgi:hypothetical protein
LTKSNQVLFRVRTGTAAKELVMDVEVLHGSAELTTPVVSKQNLEAQGLVFAGFEAKRSLLLD